jgi:poly(A) polymerase/tRNA nucleotidyltransferase (CCA-adding enzyme)
VALPRRDRSTGEGHRDFEVDFDPGLPVEQDLARRDFTVNAMAIDLATGDLIDPLGGMADLDTRLLRITYPESFAEDPLRMLRGAVFAARFGFSFDDGTWAALRRDAPRIATVSAERIRDELVKLLRYAAEPSRAVRLLLAGGLLAPILPELAQGEGVEQNEHHAYDVLEHNLRTADALPRRDPELRLAGLLHDTGKPAKRREVVDEGGDRHVVFYRHEQESAQLARKALRRLRFSERTVDRVHRLVLHHQFEYRPEWSDAAVRRLIARVGADAVEDLLTLRAADRAASGTKPDDPHGAELTRRVRAELAEARAFKVSDLAVDGRAVMDKLGEKPGPRVGAALAWLLERVLDDPSLNRPEALIALLDQFGLDGSD